MTSKFYSYSYKNTNNNSEEEEIILEDGKGKITKKKAGKIVLHKNITMEDIEQYMSDKGLNITISPDVLNKAVAILNTMMNSEQGLKNLKSLQKLNLLDIEEEEPLSKEQKDECKRILKIFGVKKNNPTKEEFMEIYKKLYTNYRKKCSGLEDDELRRCEDRLTKLTDNFNSYRNDYDC